MKLHYLRYFVVLAEELHFGRAAERLAITQPALSLAIKSLEEELGMKLLDRSSKQVELTIPAEALVEDARELLDRVTRITHAAKAVASGLRGRLEVGTTGALVYREISPIVLRFASCMPSVEVVLHEMSSVEQLRDLLQGKLDAGFVSTGRVPTRLDSLKLADDPLVLCLPATHAHADAKRLDLKKLRDERFIVFSRDSSPSIYDDVIAIFSRSGVHPKTVHATRHWLTIVAMVANGLGVSLVPRSLASSGVNGVRFIELAGEPIRVAPAFLAWNPVRVSPELLGFIDCARAVLAAEHPRRRTGRTRAA